MRFAQFINALLLALVAGVFWGTWFSLSRSIASITPDTFLEVGRTMIQNLAVPMRILFPAALLSYIPVVGGLWWKRRRTALILASSSLFMFVVALLVTLVVNVPIDNEIKKWTVASLPSNWIAIRDRWQMFHTIRTFVSVAGLGCSLASLLSSRETIGFAR